MSSQQKYLSKLGHRIKVRPCGPYQIEEHHDKLINFDQLYVLPHRQIRTSKNANEKRISIERISYIDLGEEFVSSTMIWLDWMPHLRLLVIDAQMLLKLLPRINLNNTMKKFVFLEELIIHQLDIPLEEDALSIVVQLGVLSSLRYLSVSQYKTLNSQPIDNNTFASTLCQICLNMCKLETFTIGFVNEHSFSDDFIFDELTGTEKKNCQLECIYVSDKYIQFWFER